MEPLLKIVINLENAAFEDPGPEVARILRNLADKIEDEGLNNYGRAATLRDINGNTVGDAYLTLRS